MTPHEVKAGIRELYGSEEGGQRKLAADMLVHEVTVSRWVRGRSPMDATEERLFKLLLIMHREKLTWRKRLKELTFKPSVEAFL